MSETQKKLRFGYFMSKNKLKVLKLLEFAEYAQKQVPGLECVLISLQKPLEEQGHFDLVLQKVTHLLVKTDEKAKLKIQNLQNYLTKNPKCIPVDPIENQAKTIDRNLMHKVFVHLNELPKIHKIKCPEAVIITPDEPNKSSKFPPNFRFPAICKTIQASGGLQAHEMGIIWNVESLSHFHTTTYVQEYINHDATIMKIYVIGEKSWIFPRPSFRNLSLQDPNHEPILFNSQNFKLTAPPELLSSDAGKAKAPDADSIAYISKALSHFLGLSLFGYDIVVSSETGELGVIDVNYFPDYSGTDRLFEVLLDHLLKLVGGK